jgi:hypothetical protein
MGNMYPFGHRPDVECIAVFATDLPIYMVPFLVPV